MITSISISFNPDLHILKRQLCSLKNQVRTIIVVDNGSNKKILNELRFICQELDAHLIELGFNFGIAHAQNIGINQAINLKATMILMLDQDSEPMPSMVSSLKNELTASPQAAAAGPSSIDQRTGKISSFVMPDGDQFKISNNIKSIEVGFLISSGSLIKVEALKDIGPMLAEWFIDHIDTEWCFRARSKGWQLLGVPNAVLSHRLGDSIIRFWWLRMRNIATHSPLRDYYIFRNTIFLIKRSYIPGKWKIHFTLRLFQFLIFFLIFTKNKIERLKMMLYGIIDGFKNKTGRFSK
jgi:rhamnosyltransferase